MTSPASIELQRYLKTAEKYIESAEIILASSDPDAKEIALHLAVFERYIPKIERFPPKTKEKDDAGFTDNAIAVLNTIFIVQLRLEQLYLKANP